MGEIYQARKQDVIQVLGTPDLIVVLPRGYSSNPNQKYPVIYDPRNHYRRDGPFEFSSEPIRESEEERSERLRAGYESGYEFFQTWNSDRFPQMIPVTLINPTPFYDFSSVMSSVNNGPYADAVMQKLIPYIEEHFRTIQEPYARVLIGKSSGGRADRSYSKVTAGSQ